MEAHGGQTYIILHHCMLSHRGTRVHAAAWILIQILYSNYCASPFVMLPPTPFQTTSMWQQDLPQPVKLPTDAEKSGPSIYLDITEAVLQHVEKPSTVLSCCLVCRDWLQLGLLHLYRDIHLRHPQALLSLCDTLSVQPSLRPLVRSITIDPMNRHAFHQMTSVSLFTLLPHLRRLVLSNVGSTDMDTACHSSRRSLAGVAYPNRCLMALRRTTHHVKELHIVNFAFKTRTEFMKLISAFPGLQDLRCVDISVLYPCQNCKNSPSLRFPENIRRLDVSAALTAVSPSSDLPGNDSYAIAPKGGLLLFCCKRSIRSVNLRWGSEIRSVCAPGPLFAPTIVHISGRFYKLDSTRVTSC